MDSLKSQIHSIERKLNISCSRCPKVLVLYLEAPELTQALPEGPQDWLTYQQQLRQYPNTDSVMLLGSAELIAMGLPAKKLPAWQPCVVNRAFEQN